MNSGGRKPKHDHPEEPDDRGTAGGFRRVDSGFVRRVLQSATLVLLLSAATPSILAMVLLWHASCRGDRWTYSSNKVMHKTAPGVAWRVEHSDAAFLGLLEKQQLPPVTVMFRSRIDAGWPFKCLHRSDEVTQSQLIPGSQDLGSQRLDPDYLRKDLVGYTIDAPWYAVNAACCFSAFALVFFPCIVRRRVARSRPSNVPRSSGSSG